MWSRRAPSLGYGRLSYPALARQARRCDAITRFNDRPIRLSTIRLSLRMNAGAAGHAQKPPSNLSPLWTRQRKVSIFGRRLFSMSLSEAMGHLSFVFLGLGFLETELLPLRMYAAAGVSCSIAFQYYRPAPLWIPISWNTIFLAINAGMVVLLLKEGHDAKQQGEEAAALYDGVFREAGLAIVDFMKLRALSSTSKRSEGDILARESVTQKQLYLVVEGGLEVLKHGVQIATAVPGEFVGEMSFLRHVRRECANEPEGCNCVAAADVRVLPGGSKLASWDFDELRELLSHNTNMSVAFHGALARAMASKLVDTHNPAVRYRQLLQGVLVDGVVTQVEKEELERARVAMHVDDETHRRELQSAGWTAEEFEQGYHQEENSRDYENLMAKVLENDTVNTEGRKKLREHRVTHGIDAMHHIRVLRKLGWNLDDFEEGRKGAHPVVPHASSLPTFGHSPGGFVSDLIASVATGDETRIGSVEKKGD